MAIYRMPVRLDHPVLGPQGAINVWHFRTGGTTAPGPNSEFSRAVDSIQRFYQDICGTGTTPGNVMAPGTTVIADNVNQVGTDSVFPVTFAKVTSGGTGPAAPPSLAITIGWRTSSATRRGRGRTMIGPLHGGAVEADGTVAPAFLTNLTNAAQRLVTTSTAAIGDGAGWAVGVYGLQNAGGTRQDPHVLRDLTGFKILDHFGWLRSRAN